MEFAAVNPCAVTSSDHTQTAYNVRSAASPGLPWLNYASSAWRVQLTNCMAMLHFILRATEMTNLRNVAVSCSARSVVGALYEEALVAKTLSLGL